jgi:hypothetical protein
MSELVDPDGLLAHPRVAAPPRADWITTASEMAIALDVAWRAWSVSVERRGLDFSEWEPGLEWESPQYAALPYGLIESAFADVHAQVLVLMTYLWLARAALLGLEVRGQTNPTQYARPGPTLCTPATARPTVHATDHLIIRQRLSIYEWSVYYEVVYVTQTKSHTWAAPLGWVVCTADFEMDHGTRRSSVVDTLECVNRIDMFPTLWRPGHILEREAAACAARRTADEIRDRQDELD